MSECCICQDQNTVIHSDHALLSAGPRTPVSRTHSAVSTGHRIFSIPGGQTQQQLPTAGAISPARRRSPPGSLLQVTGVSVALRRLNPTAGLLVTGCALEGHGKTACAPFALPCDPQSSLQGQSTQHSLNE